MGRFENENQMREAPMESAKAQPGRATHTNYLKKGAGAQNVLQRRKEFRARRGDELRGLLGREVLGGQQLMMTQPQQQQQQFGARPGMGFGSQQAQQQPAMMGAGTRGIESRLLSKPPLRHWGYEPSIVYQPDIDQAPNFKRRVAVRRERGARIHRVRRGVAWDIPVYDRERHEKGGLAWTIPMDKDFYEGDVKPRKTKKSKSKSLLSRFTSGVKRAFTGHHAASKQPKVAVRPQQRLAARKRGEAYTARSGLPPQAPVVEKRRLRKVEHTTDADVRKQEAFARAPGATAAAGVSSSSGVAEDRGVLVNGRRIHTTHLSEQPLMRQAPPMSEDKSAAKKLNSGRTSTTAPSGHHAAPAGHTKGHGMAAQQERRQQHVRTG